MSRAVVHVIRDGLRASAPAAVLSALPSTAHALMARRDPLEASLAAGSILLPNEDRRLPLLLAAVPVHLSLSALWGVVLSAVLPRKKPIVEGVVAGMLIAAFDLGLVGRRFPRIRALDVSPQVADHIAFGIAISIALVGRGDSGAAPMPIGTTRGIARKLHPSLRQATYVAIWR